MLTARVWFFPYHCGSICQECSNCRCCATNLSTFQSCSWTAVLSRASRMFNRFMQHAMLLLQSWQISDMGRSTRWWGQHSSPKTTFDLRLLCSPPTAGHGATNLLNTVQLILDCCAVPTTVRHAPCRSLAKGFPMTFGPPSTRAYQLHHHQLVGEEGVVVTTGFNSAHQGQLRQTKTGSHRPLGDTCSWRLLSIAAGSRFCLEVACWTAFIMAK